jgi:hypothetical protein
MNRTSNYTFHGLARASNAKGQVYPWLTGCDVQGSRFKVRGSLLDVGRWFFVIHSRRALRFLRFCLVALSEIVSRTTRFLLTASERKDRIETSDGFQVCVRVERSNIRLAPYYSADRKVRQASRLLSSAGFQPAPAGRMPALRHRQDACATWLSSTASRRARAFRHSGFRFHSSLVIRHSSFRFPSCFPHRRVGCSLQRFNPSTLHRFKIR